MDMATDLPDQRGVRLHDVMGNHYLFCNQCDAPIDQWNNNLRYVKDSFFARHFLFELVTPFSSNSLFRELYQYVRPYDHQLRFKSDDVVMEDLIHMLGSEELQVWLLFNEHFDNLPDHIYEAQPMAGSEANPSLAGNKSAKASSPRSNQGSSGSGQPAAASNSAKASVHESGSAGAAGVTGASSKAVKPETLLSPEKVDWNSSEPNGLEVKDPRDYPAGKKMYQSLLDNGLEAGIALTISRELLESGVSEPDVVSLPAGAELYKIVPEASGAPGENSPYFMTKEMLESLPEDPTEAGSYLGLPQVASSYDVYSIQAKTDVVVYQSEIAPYSVNNGTFQRSGGGVQTLVLNRKQFTSPKLLGN